MISEQLRFLTYFENVASYLLITLLRIFEIVYALECPEFLKNLKSCFFFVSYLHAWAKFYDAAAAL